jgi:hypothetical protein
MAAYDQAFNVCCGGGLVPTSAEGSARDSRGFVFSNKTEVRSGDSQIVKLRSRLLKILPRISVGGISVKSTQKGGVCRCLSVVVCAVVDGSLDLSARATSFFI